MRVIQCLYGPIPKNRKKIITECMDSVKDIYSQVEIFKFPKSKVPLYESSKWRWEFLQEHDDILYIDWDVKITKPIDLIYNDKISAIYYKGYPDDCVVYCPKKEIFRSFEQNRAKRGIKFSTFGWHRKVMRNKPCNEILTGPEYGIEHLRVSGMECLVKQYSTLQG